jgi:toxin-antitoxin system PIN domain toxin
VIALDTNILVHAHRRSSPHFRRADTAIRTLVSSGEPWALPWPCVTEFVCVVTNPKVFTTPTTTEQASAQVSAWRGVPSCRLLTETGLTEETFFRLLEYPDVVGPRVYDARIAAICLDHGVRELWTADRDYSRFRRLRTRNPLLDGES